MVNIFRKKNKDKDLLNKLYDLESAIISLKHKVNIVDERSANIHILGVDIRDYIQEVLQKQISLLYKQEEKKEIPISTYDLPSVKKPKYKQSFKPIRLSKEILSQSQHQKHRRPSGTGSVVRMKPPMYIWKRQTSLPRLSHMRILMGTWFWQLPNSLDKKLADKITSEKRNNSNKPFMRGKAHSWEEGNALIAHMVDNYKKYTYKCNCFECKNFTQEHKYLMPLINIEEFFNIVISKPKVFPTSRRDQFIIKNLMTSPEREYDIEDVNQLLNMDCKLNIIPIDYRVGNVTKTNYRIIRDSLKKNICSNPQKDLFEDTDADILIKDLMNSMRA